MEQSTFAEPSMDKILDDYTNAEEIDGLDEFTPIEDESFFGDSKTTNPVANPIIPGLKPLSNKSATGTFLEENGINPKSIKIEDEDGSLIDADFDQLPEEDKLAVLREGVQANDLDDDEVDAINFMRSNNISMNEIIESAKRQAVQEYLQNQELDAPMLDISTYSDDQIYLTDLLTKVPDISDADAKVALDNEKINPTLYKKKVDAIRQELSFKQQEIIEKEKLIKAERQAQQFNLFQQSIIDAVPEVSNIGGKIELDDSDVQDTLHFIFDADNTGTRYMERALSDPKALFKMAWFYLHGDEAVSTMANYYENQIRGRRGENKNSFSRFAQKRTMNQVPAMGLPVNPAFTNKENIKK